MTAPRLGDLPSPAKWLVTLVMLSFIMTHVSSGILVWEVTSQAGSAKEHFAYKTLAALLRMAHQHTFGHGTMYFVTGTLLLLCGLPGRVTVPLITGAFVGAWIDHASWFLLRYGSQRWEILSLAGGLLYAACFAAMAGLILYRTWRGGAGA